MQRSLTNSPFYKTISTENIEPLYPLIFEKFWFLKGKSKNRQKILVGKKKIGKKF